MNVNHANDQDVALGTSLSIRQLQEIALKAKSDQRTVAKVLRGEDLARDTHKQAAIVRITKRLHPELFAKTNTGASVADGGAS